MNRFAEDTTVELKRPRGSVVRAVLVAAMVVVLAVGSVTAWVLLHRNVIAIAGCTIAGQPGGAATFDLDPEQTANAATIAAVGDRLGMPAHAVTVALATAMQESKLRNLPGGDRDSLGLFQQRPSQGWGTVAQIGDPVYSATAFYNRLRTVTGWAQMDVTQAAQQVQRSGAPDAYAQWEPKARALAAALTGQFAAGLSCHDVPASMASADLVTLAQAELGTSVLSGPHPAGRGWAIASWLVAHAAQVGVDQVKYDGRTWTAASGAWSAAAAADGTLSLHRVGA